MLGIDQNRDFKPVNIALLTVSDTRTLENDKSGSILVKASNSFKFHQVIDKIKEMGKVLPH